MIDVFESNRCIATFNEKPVTEDDKIPQEIRRGKSPSHWGEEDAGHFAPPPVIDMSSAYAMIVIFLAEPTEEV